MILLPERLDHLLSRLGYCSRSEVRHWIREGRVTAEEGPVRPATRVHPEGVRIDGQPLDHPGPIYLVYYKEAGTVCAQGDPRSIYHDFPPRWSCRRPALSSVGRLDRDTSGILLLTDDGDWLHRWIHPRHQTPRQYRVHLAEPLVENAGVVLSSGNLQLEGDSKPCRPAGFLRCSDTEILLTLQEGRYHEVRRMMAALGNHVVALHRERFGPYGLKGLMPGEWRLLSLEEAGKEQECSGLPM